MFFNMPISAYLLFHRWGFRKIFSIRCKAKTANSSQFQLLFLMNSAFSTPIQREDKSVEFLSDPRGDIIHFLLGHSIVAASFYS